MPAHSSESFILRTYPYREFDLIVSFLTCDQGKLRGIARRARRPKSSFGSGLERPSHANASYYQKENRKLVASTPANWFIRSSRWPRITKRASHSTI